MFQYELHVLMSLAIIHTVVSTTFSSSSIQLPRNDSLTPSLVYPHPSKLGKVSGGLDVQLCFTPESVPCGAFYSSVMEIKGPSRKWFFLSSCGLVGTIVESSATGIG